MSPKTDTNTAPAIADVREVGDGFDVTLTTGRHLVVPKAVNGRYTSAFSYGATGAAVNVKPAHRR